MKKILIIQPYRFGDILQVMPVVRSIREAVPASEIHFLTDDYFAEILDANPYIKKTLVFPKMKCLADMKYRKDFLSAKAAMKDFVRELKKEEYDRVINLNFSKAASRIAEICRGACKAGRLIDAGGRRTLNGNWAAYMLFFTAARKNNPYNIVDMFYKVAEEGLGLGPGTLKRGGLYFFAPEGDHVAAERFIKDNGINPEKVVGIQAGASKKHRMALNEKYHLLVGEFNRAGYDVVFFGGGGEKQAAQAVIDASGEKARAFNSCGAFTIRQNYAMLSRMKLFITADTLNMHLAAAAAAPVLAIFYAEAYPYETGPYAPGMHVAYPAMACAPCHEADLCAGRECVGRIKMDEIFDAAMKIINREGFAMKNYSGINIYLTGIDSCYRLELQAGMEDAEAIVNGIYKELYSSYWEGIFSGAIDAFSSRVEDIWEKHVEELENNPDKAAILVMLKEKVSEYTRLNSMAMEGFDAAEALQGARDENAKNAALRRLSAAEAEMKKAMHHGEMLGSYYVVECGRAGTDAAGLKKIYRNIKRAVNGFIFALAFFMQKIHEHKLENDEEMMIV
jgi:ADP-heptose:LPS heptosyltransferase